MSSLLKILSIFLAILYPFIIFFSLTHFGTSPRILALILVVVAMVYFIANTNNARGKGIKSIQFWGMLTAATILSAVTFITENAGFVKIYPVSINFFLFLSFFVTLFRSPNMIYRFAVMQKKSIKESSERAYIEKYCRNVTIVWILFFIINGSIALFTAFFTDHFIWAIYNGFISYILIGLIFIIELIIRKRKVKI